MATLSAVAGAHDASHLARSAVLSCLSGGCGNQGRKRPPKDPPGEKATPTGPIIRMRPCLGPTIGPYAESYCRVIGGRRGGRARHVPLGQERCAVLRVRSVHGAGEKATPQDPS